MSLIKELLLADLLEQQGEEYELFVDLDGVVADFIKGMRKLIPDYSEEQYETDSKYRSMMWNAVKEYSDQGNDFWYDLELMPDAMVLWNYVRDFDPQILTATGDPRYGAGEQKRRWVAKHFGPDVPVNLARKAREKAQHAGGNRILIDDKEKAINPWREAGGIGILHTSAASTIAQLQQLGL